MVTISRLLLFVALCTSLHAAQHAMPELHSSAVFIANKGQWQHTIAYQIHSRSATIWILQNGDVVFDYSLLENTPKLTHPLAFMHDSTSMSGHVVRMEWAAANEHPELQGNSLQISRFNYFTGNNPSRWFSEVPSYKEVIVHNIYQGIDLHYTIQNNELRYDLVVQPGADESQIQMRIIGAENLWRNSDGEIVMGTSLGNVVHKNLRAYIPEGTTKRDIECSFVLSSDNTLRFSVPNRDRNAPLVIDPIVWASYLGGSNLVHPPSTIMVNTTYEEIIADIALDASENVYATGKTTSHDFPTTPGAYKRSIVTMPEVRTHAFVSKFSADGSTLIFSTYLAGGFQDRATGIVLDPSGAIVVCGYTASTDFPTTAGVYSRTHNDSSQEGFVTRMNSSGTGILASTYVGGPRDDIFLDIAAAGTSYAICGLNGGTNSFPTTTGAYQTTTTADGVAAIICVLDANFQNLTASTYLGNGAYASAIAVDGSNRIHVCGSTLDQSFPTTTDANDRTFNGIIYDGFYSVLNSSLTTLVYSSLFGGERDDFATSLTVDGSGSAYITGNTASNTFPTTAGAYDRTYNSRYIPLVNDPNVWDATVYDAFVLKLTPGSNQLGFSTYIGGINSEYPQKIILDANGYPVVLGYTYSANHPVTNCAVDMSFNGSGDAVVSILNQNGSSLLYSSFIGNSGFEIGSAMARSSVDGSLYIGGMTESGSFPVTAGAYQTTRNRIDAFIMKYNPIPDISVTAGNDIDFSCTYNFVNLDASVTCGTPPYQYLWSPGNRVSDSTSRSPTVNVAGRTEPEEFVITVTDAFGKKARNTVTVVPKLLKVWAGNDTVVCWGRTVRLKATTTNSSGTMTYNWYGPGITDASSPNTYAQPDTNARYIIIVRDALGCEAADTIDAVISRPRYKATRDTVLCDGINTIKITSQVSNGTPPYRYSWKSADGTELSKLANPSFTVTAPRTMFYITITDTLNCTSKDSVLVRMSPKMGLSIKGDTLICKGSSTTLRAAVTGGISPIAVRWTASDTSLVFVRGDTTATATLNANTTFTCYLTDAFGCVLTKTYTVKVDSLSHPTIKTTGNKTAICDGDPLQLDAGQFAGATYKWSNGATTQRITVNTAGSYAVVITGKNGCTGSDSVRITENPKPTPKMAGTSVVTLCTGDFTVLKTQLQYKAYKWSTGETTPDISVKTAGVYYVTVTDSNGCVGQSDSTKVQFTTLEASINGQNSVCANSTTQYTTPSADNRTYTWNVRNGNGQIIAGQGSNTLSIKWSGNGQDTVILVVTDTLTHCTTERVLAITISSTLKPTILLDSKPVLCANSTLKLSAPDGYTVYRWNTGATTREIDVNTPGKYSVYVEANGCSGTSDSVEVTQAPAPKPEINGATILCPGEFTTLSVSSPFRNYAWSNGEVTQSITVRLVGTYSVTVIDSNGCMGTASIAVRQHNVNVQGASTLAFGSVVIANPSTKTLTFTNASGEAVMVEDIILDDPQSVFSISKTQPPVKSLLQDKELLEISILFTPPQEKQYSAKLRIIISAPCPDTLEADISGNGTFNNIVSVVSMPEIVCDNVGRDTLLPVHITMNPVTRYDNVSLEVEVSFDAMLFYPDELRPLTRGTLLSNDQNGTMRTMKIELNNISLNGDDELTAIRGITLINTPNSTKLSPSVQWTGTLQPQTTAQDGKLTVHACFDVGRALRIISLAELLVTPNPSQEDVNITVRTGEEGAHHLTVYSQTGTLIYEDSFVNGYSYREEKRRIADMSSGVYICVLHSPFGVSSRKITVVK